MRQRAHNFTAGPSTLPVEVLERARDELLNFRGEGISIMEMSHRTPVFEQIVQDAREGLRSLLEIPDDFEVLFLQGGATLQFYMAPLNLLLPDRPADALNTGHWAKKGINELHKFGNYRLVASSESEKYSYIPEIKKGDFNPDASYVYLVSNNTIYGTQWHEFPDTGNVPIVADMTSDILSRPLDFSKFGVVFASAQKNVGIAGVTVVIIRKDLAERCSESVGTMLQYRTHIKAQTLYNTPPGFGIYMIGLMMDWFKKQGGVKEFQRRSVEKARLLYDVIDNSSLYKSGVRVRDRSLMNVIFRIGDDDPKLDKRFIEQALERGFVGFKGHRLAGGMRVSLYNAVAIESVKAFADFMREFEKSSA